MTTSRQTIAAMNRPRVYTIGRSSEWELRCFYDESVGRPVRRCTAQAPILKGDLVINPGEHFYLVRSFNLNFTNWYYLVVERDGRYQTSGDLCIAPLLIQAVEQYRLARSNVRAR